MKSKSTISPQNLIRIKLILILLLSLAVVTVCIAWSNFGGGKIYLKLEQTYLVIPFPVLADADIKRVDASPETKPTLSPQLVASFKRQREKVQKQIQQQIAQVRQNKINRVEALFNRYGSNMKGYGAIIVDQAARCGGDYRILIGIAGSESGLGRINYKKYNPYGYLNGVQYPNYATALTELSCLVSRNHIVYCGQDLYCLAKRYGGPETDLDHFVSKVRYFMNQV